MELRKRLLWIAVGVAAITVAPPFVIKSFSGPPAQQASARYSSLASPET